MMMEGVCFLEEDGPVVFLDGEAPERRAPSAFSGASRVPPGVSLVPQEAGYVLQDCEDVDTIAGSVASAPRPACGGQPAARRVAGAARVRPGQPAARRVAGPRAGAAARAGAARVAAAVAEPAAGRRPATCPRAARRRVGERGARARAGLRRRRQRRRPVRLRRRGAAAGLRRRVDLSGASLADPETSGGEPRGRRARPSPIRYGGERRSFDGVPSLDGPFEEAPTCAPTPAFDGRGVVPRRRWGDAAARAPSPGLLDERRPSSGAWSQAGSSEDMEIGRGDFTPRDWTSLADVGEDHSLGDIGPPPSRSRSVSPLGAPSLGPEDAGPRYLEDREVRALTTAQARRELGLRGLSTGGAKPVLVERLLTAEARRRELRELGGDSAAPQVPLPFAEGCPALLKVEAMRDHGVEAHRPAWTDARAERFVDHLVEMAEPRDRLNRMRKWKLLYAIDGDIYFLRMALSAYRIFRKDGDDGARPPLRVKVAIALEHRQAIAFTLNPEDALTTRKPRTPIPLDRVMDLPMHTAVQFPASMCDLTVGDLPGEPLRVDLTVEFHP
ncbi:hypothetical protein JL721_12660 [Aureococcus anophagefferens]|nr:hypothetical protein JL721_12660 [Aureococcus anophagefferens]